MASYGPQAYIRAHTTLYGASQPLRAALQALCKKPLASTSNLVKNIIIIINNEAQEISETIACLPEDLDCSHGYSIVLGTYIPYARAKHLHMFYDEICRKAR